MPLDDDAAAEIYREHGPMLRRVVLACHERRQPRRRHIVQEVILRVWKQAPEAENLRAYLVTTARHLIVDQYRAAGRRPQQAQLVEVAEQDFALDRALDQVLVEEALGRLQANHREIERCLYYERLTPPRPPCGSGCRRAP